MIKLWNPPFASFRYSNEKSEARISDAPVEVTTALSSSNGPSEVLIPRHILLTNTLIRLCLPLMLYLDTGVSRKHDDS